MASPARPARRRESADDGAVRIADGVRSRSPACSCRGTCARSSRAIASCSTRSSSTCCRLIEHGADARSLCRRRPVQRRRRRQPARGQVTAVEGDRFSAARSASAMPKGHDRQRLGGCRREIPRSASTIGSATVIVDPPRTGMSKEAMAGVIALDAAAMSSTCRATSRRWRATRGCCSMPAIGSCRRARSICFRTPRTSRRLLLSRVSAPARAPRTARGIRRSARNSPDATAPRRRTARPAFSIASITPSGEVAVTSKPSAACFTAW